MNEVRHLLNEWWIDEKLPEEQLRARVVLIYKKGDTKDLGNYRPISLLNSFYKIMAVILQKRIAEKLDEHLQATQYGFRKKRGTTDALQCIRRITRK